MAEGVDAAEAAISQTLATEIAPPSRPRDQAGKFVTVAARPEPMFGERETEGPTRATIRGGVQESRRFNVARLGGKPTGMTPTTYQGPSQRIQSGLGLDPATTMPPRRR